MAVAITREDHSISGLRREAARSRDGAAARRMLALALVLEGKTRTEAAEQCGMDRQTLRDWVHRYNAEGLAGLYDRRPPGRPPRLTPAQMIELEEIVERGADPARDGVVRFRRIDLCAIVERRFGVRIAERTMGALLAKLGLRRLSVRPQHPQSDEQAQELYKKTSPTWCARRCRPRPSASRSRSGSRMKRGSASKGP